jgi:hypothetical protein
MAVAPDQALKSVLGAVQQSGEAGFSRICANRRGGGSLERRSVPALPRDGGSCPFGPPRGTLSRRTRPASGRSSEKLAGRSPALETVRTSKGARLRTGGGSGASRDPRGPPARGAGKAPTRAIGALGRRGEVPAKAAARFRTRGCRAFGTITVALGIPARITEAPVPKPLRVFGTEPGPRPAFCREGRASPPSARTASRTGANILTAPEAMELSGGLAAYITPGLAGIGAERRRGIMDRDRQPHCKDRAVSPC